MTSKLTLSDKQQLQSAFQEIADLLGNLYGRWQDEKDYENFSDYQERLQRDFPYAITRMTKRPFAIWFIFRTREFQIKATSRQIKLTSRVIRLDSGEEANVEQQNLDARNAADMVKAKTPYVVDLETVGNPDFGQYAPITDPTTLRAASFDELKAALREWMRDWNVGMGNWTNPTLYLDNKPLGFLSYNLRLWETEEREVFVAA
jgi:hypothetical protein